MTALADQQSSILPKVDEGDVSTTQQINESNARIAESKARIDLARWITFLAIGGIGVLGAVIIFVSEGAEKGSSATLVFNAILPLFGTWVGTILAYFFAKENFETARRGTDQLVRLVQHQMTPQEKLQATNVGAAMIARNDMIVNNDQTRPLSEILKSLDDKSFKRLPVLDENDDHPIAMIYKEDIFDFLYRENKDKSDADRNQLTVQDLLNTKKFVRCFCVVGPNATLAQAKDELGKVADCRDVFVTKAGKRTDPVIGLVTNTDIIEFSQV